MNVLRLRRPTIRVIVLLAALALIAAAALVSGGCGASDAAGLSPSPSASSGPITVTDDGGEEVTLAEPAERVVSLAPANTEMAYAIGGGDKMVGGTSYDDYPEDAKALPKIGDFSSPSTERIVAMKPDLVLAAGGIQAGLRSKLEKLGMEVYVIDPSTYEAAVDDVRELGQLMGVQAQAEQVAQDMEAAAVDVTAKVGSLDKAVTFVEIYSQPLMTAGSDSFIADLVARAGGVNLGTSAGPGYPTFSSETLITEDPAVYIAVSGAQSTPGEIADRPGYAGLSAVKNERVYVIEDNLIARPGPRLAEGLQQLAQMIHPEAYQAQ